MDRKIHIMVVEDSQIQRQMLEMRLKKADLDVSSAGSGEECLEQIKNQIPDLVLLDLKMPGGKDGITVLKEIRSEYSHLALPVVILTSEESSEAILQAFEAGANDYIMKDVSFKIALHRIKIQLNLKFLAENRARAKETEAISAMIVTYNHQINNPLAIALGSMGRDYEKFSPDRFDKTLIALHRIKELVLRIQNIDTSNVEYASYTSFTKMLKIVD